MTNAIATFDRPYAIAADVVNATLVRRKGGLITGAGYKLRLGTGRAYGIATYTDFHIVSTPAGYSVTYHLLNRDDKDALVYTPHTFVAATCAQLLTNVRLALFG